MKIPDGLNRREGFALGLAMARRGELPEGDPIINFGRALKGLLSQYEIRDAVVAVLLQMGIF